MHLVRETCEKLPTKSLPNNSFAKMFVNVCNNNNNNNNIYLKSDIHKMFNRLYIKTYTNNITEIHVYIAYFKCWSPTPVGYHEKTPQIRVPVNACCKTTIL